MTFTPRRQRGFEILDDATVDAALRERSMRDIVWSNRLFGGRRAALREIDAVLSRLGEPVTVLDVGSGLGDILADVGRLAHRRSANVRTIALDAAPGLLRRARERAHAVVCGTGFALPFASRSVDIVLCSQLLHHFDFPDAEQVLHELNRVARTAVIIADLRRSWVAAAGFWLASFPLQFHSITRHDGVVSVLRGFTGPELARLIERATGTAPAIRHRVGFRLTARWQPK